MGRFWETVKPRDSGYVTGEHIGEIRKPTEKPSGNPLAATGPVGRVFRLVTPRL